jgi:hypothetical protein
MKRDGGAAHRDLNLLNSVLHRNNVEIAIWID